MRISDWSSDVCSSDLQALLDGSVRVSATYFHRDTHNQIDFDLGTFTYANIARARASGVEIGIALRPVDAFTVGANYTYTRARNRTPGANFGHRSEERTSELQSLMRISYAVFCLKKKQNKKKKTTKTKCKNTEQQI